MKTMNEPIVRLMMATLGSAEIGAAVYAIMTNNPLAAFATVAFGLFLLNWAHMK